VFFVKPLPITAALIELNQLVVDAKDFAYLFPAVVPT
jgi:hypothetical protein